MSSNRQTHPTGYAVGKYRNPETGTERWAVLGPTNCWYFPRNYGKRAAQARCRALNRAERNQHDPH